MQNLVFSKFTKKEIKSDLSDVLKRDKEWNQSCSDILLSRPNILLEYHR